MSALTLGQRLWRIEILLRLHDEHAEDCACHFCSAVDEVTILRRELRLQERAAS